MKILLAVIGIGFFVVSFFSIRAGLILMLFSMLFSPEITLGSIGIRFITVRIEDILIPLLVLAWIARLAIRRQSQFLKPSPLNLPILLVVCISLVATGLKFLDGSVQILTAIFFLAKTLEFFIIFFLVLNYISTRGQIKVCLAFILLTLLLIGIYTLTQVPNVEIFTDRRITAPFEGSSEPSTIGGYMAFLLLILVSLFLYETNLILKWVYGVIGVIVFIPFVYTLNRASYLALLGGLIFVGFCERRRWFILLFCSLLIASPLWLPKAVKERIAFTWEDAINPGRTMGVDASTQWRVQVYDRAWQCVRANLLTGCGVGSTTIADSQYARTLYETGLVGFSLWVWVFIRLFRISRWLFHSLEEGMYKGLVLGYRAGLLGILLHGFGAVTLYIVRIMEPFWFVTGLVVALYLIRLSELNIQVRRV